MYVYSEQQCLGVNLYILFTVPPVINELRNDLRDYYKSTRLKPPKEEWPPHQPTSIVSIALIHYSSKRIQQELIEISKRFIKEGAPAIDKLASSHSRVTKDINKIFVADPVDISNKIPKCILIEGAPGIGKTVLTKEIAYLWANDELLKSCNLLFLVYLRDPQLHKVKTVKELVQLYSDEKVASDVVHYLENYKGENVAFVFDGFDELPGLLQEQSLITQIIEREGLGKNIYKATVVVTSRPTATLSLYRVVERRVEILGFTKEERDKYISLSIENDQKQELDEYLNKHPIINSLCFIPLHLAILLFLFQMNSLPNTLTDMNEFFVVHTVYRQLNKITSNTNELVIKELKDLPNHVYQFVQKLSQLAYKGLQKNQLVFSYSELREVCPKINDTPGAINGFGLLQAVQHYAEIGAGRTTSFNFLHFTMQEYLAAFHVSTLPDYLQSSKMETFWDAKYNFMWMMYVGIMGVHSSVLVSFLSADQTEVLKSRSSFLSSNQTESNQIEILKSGSGFSFSDEIQNDKRKCLHLFQCYMEAKSDKIPETISSIFKGGKIKLTGITLLPHHISSLIFFMSTSITQKWRILELGNCNLRNIGINSLLEHVIKNEGNTSTLKYVDLSGNDSSPWGVYSVIIRHCCLNSLTLCGDDGMEGHVKGITDSLTANTVLETLTLCSIGRTGVKSVCKILGNKLNLIEINLSWKKIGYKKMKNKNDIILLQRFYTMPNKACSSLNKKMEINILYDECDALFPHSMIKLRYKHISNDAAAVLAFGLYNNTTVKQLDISCNQISDDGAEFISDSLMNNYSLQELNMSQNKISVKGASKIAEVIRVNTTLLKIDISLCSIPDDGVITISDCLKYNSRLQEMNISYNKSNIEGAKIVSEVIRVNSTLQKLDISYCGIPDDGLILISESYRNNETLQELIISWYDSVTVIITNPSCDLSHKRIRNNEALTISNILCNKKIKELYISHSDISDDEAVTIYSCLENNNSLQVLDMSSTKITSNGARKIAEVIKVNTTLQILNISNCGIPDDGVVVISESSKYNKTLQEVIISWNKDQVNVNTANSFCDLSGKNIGNVGALILSNLLYNKKAVQKLYISHCNISDDGVKVICDWLENAKTLQELDISHNEITSNGTTKIAEVIQVNATLQKLDISFCCITNDGAIVISNYLKNNNSLQELDMSHNKITSNGIYKIAEAIQVNTTLQKLDISYCHLSDDGTVAIAKNQVSEGLNNSNAFIKIAEVIQVNTTVQKLDISYCGIPDHGALVISVSYKSNETLQELVISWNNDVATVNTADAFCDLASKSIGNIGALIVSNLLYNKASIKKLCISHNNISNDGVMAISALLNNNNTLQELNMSYNEITIQGANKIAKAIQINTALQKLDISYCGIPDDGAVVISESYKYNKTLQELIISWRLDEVTVNTAKQSCNLHKGNIGNTGALVVSNLLYNKRTVRELKISDNNISNDGLIAISNYLMNDNTLEVLKMAQNYVNLSGANKIAEIVLANTTLRTLDISCCGITGDGVVVISGCLKNNNTLQELEMSQNSISIDGSNVISYVIRVNTTLQKLDISHCSIPDEGVLLISEACKSNAILQKLKISWNNDKVTVNTADPLWDLSDVDIGDTGILIISNILYNKRTVQKILISHNNVSKVECEQLTSTVKAITAYRC